MLKCFNGTDLTQDRFKTFICTFFTNIKNKTFRDGEEPCLEKMWYWTVFKFNMSALASLLKRQSERNPTASYFNVDILKYQV